MVSADPHDPWSWEEGADWAQSDAGVIDLFGGEWVAAINRTVVAHGSDPMAVRHAAAEKFGVDVGAVVVAAITAPETTLIDA
jgi:hypothetical protein